MFVCETATLTVYGRPHAVNDTRGVEYNQQLATLEHWIDHLLLVTKSQKSQEFG